MEPPSQARILMFVGLLILAAACSDPALPAHLGHAGSGRIPFVIVAVPPLPADLAPVADEGETFTIVQLCDGPDQASEVPGTDIDAVVALNSRPR